MNEFTHEELQRVILKYDQAHASQRQATVAKQEENEQLAQEVEDLKAAKHDEADMDMYKEEIARLKGWCNNLSNENEELKLAREVRDNLLVEEVSKKATEMDEDKEGSNDGGDQDNTILLNSHVVQSL